MCKKGKGLFDIKYSLSNKSKKTMAKNENKNIVNLYAFRQPLNSILHKIANIASKGVSKEKYGNLYHTGLLAVLENGSNIVIEKNEVVTIHYLSNEDEKMQFIQVPLIKKDLTLGELIYTAENKMGTKKFYDYNALACNCQRFVLDVLESNNLLNENIKNFIFQDLQPLRESISKPLQNLANAATKTAALYTKYTGGNKSGGKINMLFLRPPL